MQPDNSTWGVCAVAIIREHVFWIRDWVEHHIKAGTTLVVIYDNTGSTGSLRTSSIFSLGKYQKANLTKRGEPWGEYTAHISNEEIAQKTSALCSQYKELQIIKWQPTNAKGEIVHGQCEAYADFCRRFVERVDWTLFIDMDEYLFLRPGHSLCHILKNLPDDVSLIQIKQHKMPSRWSNYDPVQKKFSDKDTLEFFNLRKNPGKDFSFPKSLVRIRDVWATNVHCDWRFTGKAIRTDREAIGLCHYNSKLEDCTEQFLISRDFLNTPVHDDFEFSFTYLHGRNCLEETPTPVIVLENTPLAISNPELGKGDVSSRHLYYETIHREIERVNALSHKVNVLEWGTGFSTLVLCAELKKGSQVLTIGHSHEQALVIPEEIGLSIEQEILETQKAYGKSENYVTYPLLKYAKDRITYDLIIIDGRNRADCLAIAAILLNPNGVVILHDAKRKNYHSVFELFSKVEFMPRGTSSSQVAVLWGPILEIAHKNSSCQNKFD